MCRCSLLFAALPSFPPCQTPRILMHSFNQSFTVPWTPEQQCMPGAVAHILIFLLKLLEISHRVLLPMASRVPLTSPSISSAVCFLPQGGPFTALVSGSCQRVESASKTCYWSLVMGPSVVRAGTSLHVDTAHTCLSASSYLYAC